MFNEFEAAVYVQKIESKWYGAAYPILKIEPAKDADIGQIAFDVTTTENFWTVWVQENGTPYGEC